MYIYVYPAPRPNGMMIYLYLTAEPELVVQLEAVQAFSVHEVVPDGEQMQVLQSTCHTSPGVQEVLLQSLS